MTQELKMLQIAVKAAHLYTDALIDANKKAYFNTPIGASVRNIRFTLQEMSIDLMEDFKEKSPEFTLKSIETVRSDVQRSHPDRFKNEKELLSIFNQLADEYTAYANSKENEPEVGMKM